MKNINVTCIMCPRGCLGTVQQDGNNILKVTGFTCKRGEEYGREEVTAPKRMLTTTVKVANGALNLLPVVSKGLLPKEKIMDCVHALSKVIAMAPVREGDVVAANILGLGVDIVASRDLASSM